MVFVATAGAGLGSAIIGGAAITAGLGYLGSQQASKAQVGAETQALGLQQQQLTQLQPYENAGAGAAATLSTLTGSGTTGTPNYSAFANSPDYAFAQSQGNDALIKYLNATGMSQSGAGITAAINYNQGLATQQYGNYFNRLMQIAQLGSGAAGTGVGGTNAAANTIGNIGQSQAAGIIGGTNAVTGSLNSGINNSLLYGALRAGQANPSGYASIAGSGSPATTYPNPNVPGGSAPGYA